MERTDDLNTPAIAVTGVIGVVLVVATILGVQVLYYRYDQVEFEKKVVDAPTVEADNLFAEQEARLNRYGWIDREKGQVAIPIDRAMELVTSEFRQQQEESRDDS